MRNITRPVRVGVGVSEMSRIGAMRPARRKVLRHKKGQQGARSGGEGWALDHGSGAGS